MTNIAIIPARGGSKGIPKKNLADLCGRPLISYTLEAALNSKCVDQTYVSTDDDEIAQLSQALGAEVVRRPVEIAQDDTPTLPAVAHVLSSIQVSNKINKVIILQATSPLRQARHIDEAFESFSKEYSSVVSVCEVEHTPYKMYRWRNQRLTDFVDKSYRRAPRQKLPKVYRENGAVYVTTSELIFAGHILGDKPKPYFMSREESADIDVPFDLKMARLLLKERDYG